MTEKKRTPLPPLVGDRRVPWLRKLEDNPALPDRKPGYNPDPIELDAEGKRVSKAELYQRMVNALADPACTALRAIELQRIWMRLPGCGLRSWGHIVADAAKQAARRAQEAGKYVAETIVDDGAESYAAVFWVPADSNAPKRYICTVYIPAPAGQEPKEAIATAQLIAEALNLYAKR